MKQLAQWAFHQTGQPTHAFIHDGLMVRAGLSLSLVRDAFSSLSARLLGAPLAIDKVDWAPLVRRTLASLQAASPPSVIHRHAWLSLYDTTGVHSTDMAQDEEDPESWGAMRPPKRRRR
jgi:hypothetical protein